MSAEAIAHQRVQNLGLAGAPFHTAAKVVNWLGAVQAQDYAPAKWSVAQRSTSVTNLEVEGAFNDGAILRTHVLRPTWHFVSPADIRWMLELTKPRSHALSAYAHRREELDAATLRRCHTAIANALEGGQQLTRNEMGLVLMNAGITALGTRLAHILMHAELEGLICSGAVKGKQHTFALLDERVPAARPLARDEALVELTRRYFTSHGPARAKDFQWWSSLTSAEIRRGIKLAGSFLEHEIIDDIAYWCGTSALPPAGGASPRVHLVQMFDEYLVGYSETRGAFDVAGIANALFTTVNVRSGVVILDTQAAGTWRRTARKDDVLIEARVHKPLDASQMEALQTEADRFGAFVGLPATVQIQTI